MSTGQKVFSTALAVTLIGAGGLGIAGPAAAAPGSSSVMVPSVTVEQPVITIEDFSYAVPGPVAAGTVVTVVNNDRETHTVTAVDGSFDVTVTGGTTATFTAPTTAGNYAFFCAFHSNMEGTLTVEAPAQEPAAAPTPPAAAQNRQVPQEPVQAPVPGMDQMEAVPKGGADTGVSPADGNGMGLLAAGTALVLAAAAAAAFSLRRRNNGV